MKTVKKLNEKTISLFFGSYRLRVDFHFIRFSYLYRRAVIT